MGRRVYILGVVCGVWGVGSGVRGVGCGVWGVGCGVWNVGCGVWNVGCGVWGVGCGVWGVEFGGYMRVAHKARHDAIAKRCQLFGSAAITASTSKSRPCGGYLGAVTSRRLK